MDPVAMRLYLKALAEENSEELEPEHCSHPISKRKFTNKDMKYEFVMWENLPQKVKRELKNVGFHRPKWDTSNPPIDAHFQWWEDLSCEERESLKFIGWDESAWDSAYQDHDWEELPKLQKRAAKEAGYTRDTWNEEEPEELDCYWDDLPKKRAHALAVLGWTKYAWDNGMD